MHCTQDKIVPVSTCYSSYEQSFPYHPLPPKLLHTLYSGQWKLGITIFTICILTLNSVCKQNHCLFEPI